MGGYMGAVYGKGDAPRPCTVFKTNRANEIGFGAGNSNFKAARV